MLIFVDSSAFTGLYNPDDVHADYALAISEQLKQGNHKLTTSSYIGSESLTGISQRAGKRRAVAFGEYIFGGSIPVVHIDKSLEQKSYKKFLTVTNKNISFVDCSCFVICDDLGITNVFTFDKHFAKQGFTLLKP